MGAELFHACVRGDGRAWGRTSVGTDGRGDGRAGGRTYEQT
jgi:hypothetical protein